MAQWWGFRALLKRVQIQSLVRELRSNKPQGTVKKLKKEFVLNLYNLIFTSKYLCLCICVCGFFFLMNNHFKSQGQKLSQRPICSSIAKSCPTLCNPTDCSKSGSSGPPPSPRVCSNSCPLSQRCYLTMSISGTPFSFCLHSFTSSGSFPGSPALGIRQPKYWSFSNNPSNEYSGLITFKTDCFHFRAVQGTLKSSPTPQFESIDSLALSFLYDPTLTSIHDYWKNHSFE